MSLEHVIFPAGATSLPPAASGGWCRRCGQVHWLPSAQARQVCHALMDQLAKHRRIDFPVAEAMADPRCATGELFGASRGKMFGVLTCRDPQGRSVVLRSFSGQYTGLWQVEGWVGPLFALSAFEDLIRAPEQAIKRLGREMDTWPQGSEQRRRLIIGRRKLSQNLMQEIHALYQLSNFRGERVSLAAAYIGNGAPPAGTADCCGPKLLQHAAMHGLVPESMAEFYWGRSNASDTKQHGRFYPACAAKCQTILGFMLCGLQPG